MFTHKALIKICLEGGDKEVCLLSEYEPKKNLILKVLDIQLSKSYSGQVSDLDLRNQAARIGLTFSDFIDQSIQALFQESSEQCSFIYALHKNNEEYQFKWKSVDHEETIITLGCIDMMQQEYVPVIDSVLVCLAKEILDLNLKVKSLTTELVECKSQTENAINQLSEAVNFKKNLETELFSKFLLVLNEKKRKIKDLQCGKSVVPPKTCVNKRVKSELTRIRLISESSDENVDEFPNLNEPGPSTAAKRSSFPFHDDDEEDSVVPVRPSHKRDRSTAIKTKSFPEEIISSNVKSTLSQVMDDDSDDLLHNL